MTKRQPHELQRPINCDTSYAEGLLSGMEAKARAGDIAGRLIGTRWLTVFTQGDGSMAYNWQGGYPTNSITRATAVSVLAHA